MTSIFPRGLTIPCTELDRAQNPMSGKSSSNRTVMITSVPNHGG